MQKSDGMFYAPEFSGVAEKVVKEGEFRIAALRMDHGHIYGMVTGLVEAGATLAVAYDPDPIRIDAFKRRFPDVKVDCSDEDILDDPSIDMVVIAAVPSDRAGFAVRAMESGKHVFVDKPGFLSVDEMEMIRDAKLRTGKKYYIYFSERVHVEGSICAEQLCREGAVGKVLNVTVLAPHRLKAQTRPDWFWDSSRGGSILNDIGCHQIEQFLAYTGARSAEVVRSSMANWSNPGHPGFYDYGDCYIVGDNGATCFFKVDWFTPDGMGAWGDGRVFITGTDGCIEVRKYIDVAQSPESDHVYFTDREGEHLIRARGRYGFRYFGMMIRDCIDGTDEAIDPERTFEAMRLAIEASANAVILH